MASQPTPIKFYTDKHIARAVAVQLRMQGVDIVRCEEVGLADVADFDHLEYAAREGRVIITNDDDFLGLNKAWYVAGKNHGGIMYCLPHIQGEIAVGKIVQKCLELHELITGGAGTVDNDIVNQVFYVS